MTKQPSYRFAGYTEAWEEKKLGEVVDVNSGKDYKHLSKGEIPVYGTGGYMLSVSESLSDADGIGIGRKGTIDKPYILKAPFWTVDTLFYCIPRDAYNLYFVYSIFNNVTWKKFDESTGVPSLSKITINNIQSSLPSLPEQTVIGSFFQDIDQLISLQQRKLEVLKEQKKTDLKLLFPAKGQTKPALRFAGFEDDWKEVKLGEVLTERNIQMVPSDKVPLVSFTVENGVTPKTERYNREFLVREDSKKYKYTRYNDIVYNPANLKFGAIARNKYGEAVFSPIYVTFEVNYSNILPEFIEGILTSKDFIQQALKFQEGTVYERMAVKADDFTRLAITVPSLPEQEAIGSFFQDLDKAIAKQEEKVNQLKESKQTLLRKMFI